MRTSKRATTMAAAVVLAAGGVLLAGCSNSTDPAPAATSSTTADTAASAPVDEPDVVADPGEPDITVAQGTVFGIEYDSGYATFEDAAAAQDLPTLTIDGTSIVQVQPVTNDVERTATVNGQPITPEDVLISPTDGGGTFAATFWFTADSVTAGDVITLDLPATDTTAARTLTYVIAVD